MLRHIKGKAGPLLGLTLLFCACSPSAQDGAESGANDSTNEVETARFVNRMSGAEQPTAPSAEPFQQSEKTDLLEFLYTWPAQAGAVPDIVAKFRRDMEAGKADALKMAADDRKSAQQSGYPFHAHSLETRWTVAADTPRFLSLQSSRYTYTGGAHGMTGYDALLWDKARKRETSMRAVMTSPSAFAAAISDPFCAGLDQARAKKRGGPIMRGDDPFTECVDPMRETLVPVSKDGELIEAIKVVIGPYSAGPYSEGTYEVHLPVDAAMRKVIKTEYQDAFVAK
jgi:hypothetical protein